MNEQKCIWCHLAGSEELVLYSLTSRGESHRVWVHQSHLDKVRFYTKHIKTALIGYALSLVGIFLGLFVGEPISMVSFLALSVIVFAYPVATPSSVSFFGMKRTHQIVRTLVAVSVVVVAASYWGT